MRAADVMTHVVARIVEQIEAGADDWQMPWRSMTRGWPTNAATGNPYSGGNALFLALVAQGAGYSTSRWATYKQWASLGAQVRKGERGTRGIYWHVKPAETITEIDDATGETIELQSDERVAWARSFTVFNAAQVDHDSAADVHDQPEPLARIEVAEAFFGSIPAEIHWNAANPAYCPGSDTVRMPRFDHFHTAEDAYATLAHELGHWTGHESRLKRDLTGRFGDDAYAAEELIAELSAAMTCTVAGIDTVARTDHAGYLAHWCRILRQRPANLWTVASRAQAATDHLTTYYNTPEARS